MTRLSFQNILSGIALGIAALYITLALTAIGCLFVHAAPSDGHHRHSGTESHSPLCSWVCQATSDVGSIAQEPTGAVWPAQPHVDPSAVFRIAAEVSSSLRARAPPVSARG